jgi:glycosyltransferase involved in cell wall biosynthesis
VLVLHDPVLHHLVEELTLGAGDSGLGPRAGRDAYAAVLRHCHGAAGVQVARLRECGVFSDAQRYRMPLHGQVVDASAGVLVHSAHAAAQLRGTRDVPVRVVRHHVSPAVWDWDRMDQAAARRRLGVPPDVPVLLSLGFATGPKQLPLVLQALARLRQAGQDFHYVVGGAADAALELPRLVAELGLEDQVTLTGWLAEEAFFTWARAADLLVNLRFPVGGETSGTLARALGMGLPALVFDHGPSAEWPDDVVFKLAFSADPLAALAERLGALLRDRAGLAARGRRAMQLARATGAVALTADGYLAAIRDWQG